MQKRSAPKGMNVFVLASDIIIGVKPKIDDFCQIAKKIEVFFISNLSLNALVKHDHSFTECISYYL